jgi:hypothetical protein
LAFTAGLQLSLMPIAIGGVGMSAGDMPAGCGGCAKQDMGVTPAACIAHCVPVLATIDPAPLLLRLAACRPGVPAVPLPVGLTVPPDSSPPRA